MAVSLMRCDAYGHILHTDVRLTPESTFTSFPGQPHAPRGRENPERIPWL